MTDWLIVLGLPVAAILICVICLGDAPGENLFTIGGVLAAAIGAAMLAVIALTLLCVGWSMWLDAVQRLVGAAAVRGTDASGARYDLISPHMLQALAETYAEGAVKYGDDNWLKGIPSKDLMNHAMRHLVLWQLGDQSEPHLAHAIWNLGAIIHFEKTRPELIERQYAIVKGGE